MTLVASDSTSHHAHVVGLDHHLEGARVQEVADQHAGGVAEGRVGRLAAASQGRLVDDVVVQQRGGVDELDHRGQQVMAGRQRSSGRAPSAAAAPGASACRLR
jgi:hypothetical protein